VIVDAGDPVVVFNGVANGTLTFGDPNPVGGFGVASWAGGTMFDISNCDAWSIYGQVLVPGSQISSMRMHYFADLIPDLHDGFTVPPANVSEFQHLSLPDPTNGAFMIVGRTLGPVLAVELDGFGGTFHIEVFAHNRTRVYDAPYTPGLLGTVLANIPSTVMAINAITTAAVPYYLGPARLSLSASVRAAVAAGADVISANAGTLASVTAGPPSPVPFWIPANAGLVTLRVLNGAAAANLGATLIAA
jgi:hypothetical protein